MTPSVGVCVLNWNSGDCLVSCIRSFYDRRSTASTRVVVVDNSSRDSSLSLLRSTFPEIPVIETGSNLGYAKGNNVGAKYLLALGCEFLVFLNPDVSIELPAMKSLMLTLVKHPTAGCAGGAPLKPSGAPAVAARNRPSALDKIVAYGPLRRIPALESLCKEHWLMADNLQDGAEVYALCGACLAFRADVFRQIGGFDEATFLYEEEFIMAERLRERGWRSVLSKRATYSHAEAVSTSHMPFRRKLHLYESESYLLRRYYRWNPLLRGILRLYRYVEWIACMPFWWILHVTRAQPKRHRP